MSCFSSPAMRQRDQHGARTRSVPALKVAYSLRDVGCKKKLLAMEYTKVTEQFPLETIKDRQRRWELECRVSRMAQREEDERGLVKAEMKRQQKEQDILRETRRGEILARNERRRAEMVKLWRAEQAAVQRAEAERVEQARQIREAEEKLWNDVCERERLKRCPEACQTCEGSGLCQECGGTGMLPATFLASAPGSAAQGLQFGTTNRGCTSCFGCDQGIRGELKAGSGVCTVCAGAKQFCTGWCHIRPPSRGTLRRLGTGASRPDLQTPDDRSPTASPKASASAGQRDQDATPKVCGVCRGSVVPSLAEAEWLWAQPGDGEQGAFGLA